MQNVQTAVTTGTTASPRRLPRILRWIGRALLGLVVVIFALVVFGILYESVMAAGDAGRFPAPGQLIMVNGHQMHIQCSGEGSPAVVLEAGIADWSYTWEGVQPQISATTRTCSYDRAGYGWSESVTEPRSPEQIAIELHALLEAAEVPAPYVLLGHSLGGKHIRMFAELYPDEVAGLVFEDARHESAEPQNRTPEQNRRDGETYESSLGFYRTLRQIGIARIFGLPLARALDPSTAWMTDDQLYQVAQFRVRESTLQTMIAESRGSTDSDTRLAAARSLEGLPVIVLSADSSLETPNWENVQRHLAELSSNSRWITVADSSHFIHIDQPQAVIEAINTVVNAARTGNPLN